MDGRGRLDLRRGVGPSGPGERGRPGNSRKRSGLRRRSRAREEARSGHLSADCRSARPPERGHARGRGLPQRPAGGDRRRPALPGHGQRLHPRRGFRRGRPGRVRARRPWPAADRGPRQPWRGETRRLPHARRPGRLFGGIRVSTEATEQVVRTIAETAIENEKYFGDLDAVVGDGDFGYSLARGFEKLLESWSDLDRSNSGTFLKRTGMVIASRIGGTSGPLWGTAFIRAGAAAGDAEVDGEQAVAMLRAAIDGIKTRGQSDVGDKTLLDALVPMTDRLEAEIGKGASAQEAIRAAAAAARAAADATSGMVAKRGRAAYTGERSRGSVDAGATAVAVIAERISETWKQGAAS